MPRKKKNGHSPARLPVLLNDSSGGNNNNTGYRQGTTTSGDGAMASSNFQLPNSPYEVKAAIVQNMQEIFSHLDPEVIHIVLAECDFKVENAMDSLLELSVAADGVPPLPPRVSGFELTAALLGPRPPEPSPAPDPPTSSSSSSSVEPPPSSFPPPPAEGDPDLDAADLDLSADLTEEFDLLIDRELETLTNRGEVEGNVAGGLVSLSSLPAPPAPQQALPELLQTSMEPTARGGGGPREPPCPGRVPSAGQASGAHSSVGQLGFVGAAGSPGQRSQLDFSHLTSADAKSNGALDLGATGRPSAFQAYRKQGQFLSSTGGQAVPPGGIVGGARAKTSAGAAGAGEEPLSTPAMFWNTEVAEFIPRVHGNQQGPAFIIPVAGNPSPWNTQTMPASRWVGQGSVRQAPLKPAATIPKSWALPSAPQAPLPHGRFHLEGRVLVLLRGAPGSGKSTLARAMLEQNPGGVVLSTDDYFSRHGDYHFDPSALGEAHEWNHKRAKEAFENNMSPVIIDNTNMQSWEMRPYVAQALKHKYKVLFREPDTWWKKKPRELQRRTKHGVPVEKIRRMLEGYDRFVTIQAIMGSQAPSRPEREGPPHQDGRPPQPLSSDAPQPDLVGNPQLFSFLPDVSSVGGSGKEGTPGHSSQGSMESLHSGSRAPENPEIPGNRELADAEDKMDLGELDAELDIQLELGCREADRGMPDCVVELVLNVDHRGDERPAALSESIGQRARRGRRCRARKPDSGGSEPADLVKDTNQAERDGDGWGEGMEAEVEAGGGERLRPELLDFVGDWPSEEGLGQRVAGGRRGRRPGERGEGEGASEGAGRHHNEAAEGRAFPDVTEFRKLLDLIQTGVNSSPIPTCSSPEDSSHSCDSGQSSEEDGAAGGSGNESHSSASGEGRGQVLRRGGEAGRAELPDCVLDWKASDSALERAPLQSVMVEPESEELVKVEGSHIAEEGGVLTPTETEGVKLEEGKKQGVSLHGVSAASAASEDRVEVEGGHDGEVSQITEASHVTKACVGQADIGKEKHKSATEVESGGHIGEVGSPPGEGSVEGDVGHVGGGSQERKQRPSRRSGKQCKLALTFTQNCPSPKPLLVNPEATASDRDPSFNPEPRPLTPPPSAETARSTQTDPRDFALLWRLDHHDGYLAEGDLAVVRGDPSRFLPELSLAVSAAVAVHPSAGRRQVPYRVVHEKGTQLEERDLGGAKSRLESLRILSRHFKLVGFDTLEDLYDKCHQDLEWTTDLLLDSGERLFRDEDAGGDEDLAAFALYGGLGLAVEAGFGSGGLDEKERRRLEPEREAETPDAVGGGQPGATRGSNSSAGAGSPVEEGPVLDNQSQLVMEAGGDKGAPRAHGGSAGVSRELFCPFVPAGPGPEVAPPLGGSEVTGPDVTSETPGESGTAGGSEGAAESEEARGEGRRGEEEEEEEGGDEASAVDELTLSLLAQLEEMERAEEEKERREREKRRSRHLDIRSVELKLPTEVALQLTELFGPVGVEPGACSADDYAVRMDLNVARLLHRQWKDTIQEKQRQAALSYHLLQESSVHWGESQAAKAGPREGSQPAHFLIGVDGFSSLGGLSEAQDEDVPFMDHWSTPRPRVSLRDIMTEEQVLQENMERSRQGRAELDKRDGATLLKESQLYDLFPSIDRHFLQDIFRDHSYCLTETEQFLRSLLDESPVRTVVAPEPHRETQRTSSKERDKPPSQPQQPPAQSYQDVEDPEYEDFRAEASLQRSRQHECFAKAAEAYRQGRKDVASFYAQQGHLHGQRMREANHRAAMQIFQQVNASLLPQNILDLHGLHVDEALNHLGQVLHDKTSEWERGLCRPQLSVITGRGNHSQGGVARIRPAVIDYLTSQRYRYSEPKPGVVLVSLN